ncbi:shikimate dehydrogenase family protein [Stappia sp.]|uniref:shikimate dehydrogenase family protein n=1 Tax=Stappia sp. TaxID=1870903 RepID=UPI003A997A7A
MTIQTAHPRITGRTACLPIIGHPVKQVHTPPAINGWLATGGIDAAMFAMDVAPGATDDFFALLRQWGNCLGCSVTVPHKQAAFLALDSATQRATRIRAANIVRRDADGRLSGDMTDGLALVHALRAAGFRPDGARVLVAGAGGGAGMAIVDALCEAGVREMALRETDPGRLQAVTDLLRVHHSHVTPHVHDTGGDTGGGFDLAVNATALGMRAGDPVPFEPSLVKAGGHVADVVTPGTCTPLLTAAQAAGLRCVDGAAMAEAQLPFQMAHLGLLRD